MNAPMTDLLTIRAEVNGEVVFHVEPNCEHDHESCQCVCTCGGLVWHDHAEELWGPVNWDLPDQDETVTICPDAPIYYAASA